MFSYFKYYYSFLVFSGLLACIVIYFDRVFIDDLCKCYLGDQLCCAVRGIESLRANYSAIFEQCTAALQSGHSAQLRCPSVPHDKLKLIQAQLGCAVGILVTCGVYVIIYLFACLGICFGHD